MAVECPTTLPKSFALERLKFTVRTRFDGSDVGRWDSGGGRNRSSSANRSGSAHRFGPTIRMIEIGYDKFNLTRVVRHRDVRGPVSNRRTAGPSAREHPTHRPKRGDVGTTGPIETGFERPYDIPPSEMSERCMAARERAVSTVDALPLASSGSGDGTMHIANATETRMLSAPSRGGFSHSPREWTDRSSYAGVDGRSGESRTRTRIGTEPRKRVHDTKIPRRSACASYCLL